MEDKTKETTLKEVTDFLDEFIKNVIDFNEAQSKFDKQIIDKFQEFNKTIVKFNKILDTLESRLKMIESQLEKGSVVIPINSPKGGNGGMH